jgi:kynureninase
MEPTETWARQADAEDPLRPFRDEFVFPPGPDGQPVAYFAGNSLGLQPKRARQYIAEALDDWAQYGVEGHFKANKPWLPYHEQLTEMTARLVGAKPLEVVVMNTLTVNLHLMMVSFYRPTQARHRILIEGGAFPSDQYAVASQARVHGFDPKEAIVELVPRAGEETLRPEDILAAIAREGDRLALVMLGCPNFRTGQAFDLRAIAEAAHRVGAHAGFDLAHGAGNLRLELHESGADFAVWCGYKYLNGGPGTLAGCFVHERHARSELPRFTGWWGHDKAVRFKMEPTYVAIPGAEGWQLSNPPIFQMAAMRASLELFDRATMRALRDRGDRLTGYLESLLESLPKGFCQQITPRDPKQRGSQLSLRVKANARELVERLSEHGIVCDFREPDVIRAAPAPLYSSFSDVHRFVRVLDGIARS